MTYYSGRVHSVVHESSGSFYVLKMVLDDTSVVPFDDYLDGKVTVRGTIPGLGVRIGSWFGFEADWTTHKTYGRQLVITKAPLAPKAWDAESAEKALVANGVGERFIQQVRNHFGDDTFVEALGDVERLKGVPNLDPFVALHISNRWATVQTYFRALIFLNDLGLPPAKVSQVWALFEGEAEKVLVVNPWEIVRVDGVTFQQADEVALRMNLDLSHPNRLRGAAIHACKNLRSYGHLYVTTGQLFSEVQSLVPDATKDAFAKALSEAHKDGVVVIDRDIRPDVHAVYDPWAWKIEKESADLLVQRVETAAFVGDESKDYIKLLGSFGPKTEKEAGKKRAKITKVAAIAVDEWETTTQMTLSEAQRKGVINALTTPVSIMTGLPGTGKTTCLLAVVSILKDMGIRYLLCAPTGIAAKNLGAKANAHAYTIHRAFSAKGNYESRQDATYVGVVSGNAEGASADPSEEGEEWGYDPEHPYPADVVIVDEASMLDQHLLYRVLGGTSKECRLVIVGDAAQLPSVGPGNVLRDLIKSRLFPTVALTEIFRQKDTSGIVYAAHAIHRGDTPDTETPDFKLLPLSGEADVADAIVKMAVKLKEAHADFQILSPRHASVVGVTALNTRLRELLNPGGQGAQEVNIGDSTIREGDRVMVVKNDYNLGVFNGDVGKVVRIDRRSKDLEVKIHGDPVIHIQVPIKKAGALLRLAYCCTVHKCQGLEYDVIVMPVVESFRHQLQRNLLYTAVTRARKRVFLIGSNRALNMAVVNDREDQRNTLFRDRLVGGMKLAKSA